MADLSSTYVANNFNKFAIHSQEAVFGLVVPVTKSDTGNLTNAVLLAVYRQLTAAGGSGNGSDTNGPDAFTFAAFGTADGSAFVSGTTTDVFFRLQGSGGTPNTTTASGATITVIANFKPAL